MAIRFYNTLTRNKDDFKTLEKGRAKIYSCGPTVYNYAHIGNLRSFVFSDILRRYLKFRGYEVEHVMNLTDVDDKTINGSKKEGISLKEYTEKYARFFFQDLKTLNIEKVEHYPKATETIPEMVDIVQKLLDKGYAYKGEDGSIYYMITKFADYGKLSKIDFEQLKEGARVAQDDFTKRSNKDFALWKAWDEDDGDVFWETKVGKGRPGWHIECSAMSMKYLGKTFDIHTGGIDLIFPHHENEIAQSEAANDAPFVNYWLHCEHLIVEGEKMSKSKGNFYILKEILDKGYSPKAVRYLLLSTHYRQKLNFTFDGLDAAEKTVEKFREFMARLKKVKEGKDWQEMGDVIDKAKNSFIESMDDDLNISGALGAVFEFIHDVNRQISEEKLSRNDALLAFNLMMEFDKVLGVLDFKEDKAEIPKEILDLAEKRKVARDKKDWTESDSLRDEIKKKGFEIKDTKEGYELRKI